MYYKDMKKPEPKSDHAYIFFLIGVIGVCLTLFFISKYDVMPEVKKAGKVTSFDTIIKYVDIPKADSLVLIKLIPVLKSREGLRLKPYQDKKFNWYIGYGHLMTEKYIFWNTPINEKQADAILWDDIKKAYFERQRIYRKSLYDDCYNIFISGHLKLIKR